MRSSAIARVENATATRSEARLAPLSRSNSRQVEANTPNGISPRTQPFEHFGVPFGPRLPADPRAASSS
jgi:hypothetical protein